MRSHFPEIFKTQVDFLLFRPISPDIREHFPEYLVYVLLVTLVAGVGRYWDHLDAEPWQYFGIGSVCYVLVLSLFLYLIVLPLKPERWSYRSVLVFVGLTSLPAVLYAVPVERFMALGAAQGANAMFLALVAFWRVALYVNYLRKVANLEGVDVLVALLLPLSLILVSLSLLNLEHAVFQIMAGNPVPPTAGDLSYFVVLLLSALAYVALPITLGLYLFAIYKNWKRSGAKGS